MSVSFVFSKARQRKRSLKACREGAERTIVRITIVVLLVLLFSGVNIAIAMVVAGAVGLFILEDPNALLISAKIMFDAMDSWTLLAVPMFIVMGSVIGQGGLGTRIYHLLDAWLRRIPGGVGIATVGSCGLLASMCGTSAAISGMGGSGSLPPLQKYGYRLRDAQGLIAAGGTLGILIPPSASMVIYGALTGSNIAALFMAGVIPGIMIMIFYMIFTTIHYRRSHTKAELQQFMQTVTWKERWQATKGAAAILLLPLVIMIPLYTGIATATEVAAIGTIFSLILVFGVYRTKGIKDILPILRHAANSSLMIGFIICGAFVFGAALTNQGLPMKLADMFVSAGLPVWAFIAMGIIIKIIMGTFMEGASITLILLPILIPGFIAYHVDLVWYCVIFVVVSELGLLTPPVGLNVFMIHGVAKDLGYPSTIMDATRGSMPYMFILLIAMFIILFVPQIATWLPSQMS